MNRQEALDLMNEKGIVFPEAKYFINKDNMTRTVQDAAVTASNSGIPSVMTTFVDPMIVQILTAPINAREIFGEVRKGDWTTGTAVFRSVEQLGHVTAYSDYGNGGMADINVNYPQRDNYLGQINIKYGEREMAVFGKNVLNLAAEKQTSAAWNIDKAANWINLYGLQGKNVYGLLNDPDIPEALVPASIAGRSLWKDKDNTEVYKDILAMAAKLFKNTQGLVTTASDLVLAVPPELNVSLGMATQFNVSVMDMLKKYFTKLTVVTLPELEGTSDNTVMLCAREMNGQPVAQFGYSEKMRAFPVNRYGSYYEQKFMFGSYGCIIFRPMAIVKMVGC